jgi:antitoxin MazE
MQQLKVARWGNSLAVRLPASLVKSRGLAEGDAIQLEVIANTKADQIRLKEREKIIAAMESLAVPLPADYKFDREEANAR